ncbi:MAG: Lin1244/Lin1753 domain-containing protein [Aerococcus sanguinicola]|uniref:Lin1244/Lin1753 domain-containing protein n=1 Tax=Aerococcus sp. HMSC062A02 TaxID=1715105 RepID=UPI0008A58967|nr:Lin1244/Lin1753 domain-containing protein [Aerococcus sp. HMSC062A02]OFN02608.1 hypothetical protein HMPREF2626_01470 [Aerococcus sp. HMSC062A02]
MARPTKDGLDYFPLDVDIFENAKIEAIAGEFGAKGELLVIKLLCAVYKEGYYVVWNELLKMQLLKRVQGASIGFLEQVVNRLVEWGTFDKNLFNSAKVLTSVRIQENYRLATSRRKNIDMSRYCLLDVDNNPNSSGVNDNINPQSKRKESKRDQSKLNNISSTSKTSSFSAPENKNPGENSDDVDVVDDDLPPVLGQKTLDFYQDNFGFFQNSLAMQTVQSMAKNYGDDLVIHALTKAIEVDRPINYANTILKNWQKQGVTTVKEAEAADKSFERKKSKKYGRQKREEDTPEWLENQKKERQSKTPEQPKQADTEGAKRLKEMIANRDRGTIDD